MLLVYSRGTRDLTPLELAAKELDIPFRVAADEPTLLKTLAAEAVSIIVVSLSGDEEGWTEAREFADAAAKALLPEDAEIRIVFSNEGYTPQGWHDLDPRPIRGYGHESLLQMKDMGFQRTIALLGALKFQLSHTRLPGAGVEIDVDCATDSAVPFPTEACYLIRAAFRDMKRVTVTFPNQGFSGSIACVIEPTDGLGTKCRKSFAKIYHEEGAANRELGGCLRLEPYLPQIHYPVPKQARRYRGRAYSIVVTDLAEGPERQVLNFRKMMETSQFTSQTVGHFAQGIVDLLRLLPHHRLLEPRDLVREYLGGCLDDVSRRRKLESENTCHKWFGSLSDLTASSFSEVLRASLPPASLQGSMAGLCHGDLHTENILARCVQEAIIPVLVDFSMTSEDHHGIKDLVTLECDLVIRTSSIISLPSWLEGLEPISASEIGASVESEPGQEDRRKMQSVVRTLREVAAAHFCASHAEYFGAAMLQALRVLSRGNLTHIQSVRASAYVTYLLGRIRSCC